jgi:hypothetical protein
MFECRKYGTDFENPLLSSALDANTILEVSCVPNPLFPFEIL